MSIDEIKKLITVNYIKNSSIIEVDHIREKIKNLVKYLPLQSKKIFYTDFGDDINIIEDDDIKIPEIEFSDYKKKVNFYLENHLDNKVIQKIRNNEPISKNDIDELQNILFNDLNTNKNEFNLNYNNESLVLLVRNTVGVSKDVLDREFAKYINENELNAEQTRFINLIKNYIIRNGVIDKRILNEDPFTNYGSIVDVFNGKLNIVQFIIQIIDLINKNGDFTNGTNAYN